MNPQPGRHGKRAGRDGWYLDAFLHGPKGDFRVFAAGLIVVKDNGQEGGVAHVVEPHHPHLGLQGGISWGRDPKLIWHAPTKKWIIVTYRMGNDPRVAKNGRMAFYSSSDLKDWTEESLSDQVRVKKNQRQETPKCAHR